MQYPAHIRIIDREAPIVQTVSEHSEACARYAADYSIPLLANAARLAGLLHDVGKYISSFKEYIEKAARGEPVVRGSVNHTFAGVRFVIERWHKSDNPWRRLACEMIAVAIGSHHRLFDCVGAGGADGYEHRLKKDGIHYEEAVANFEKFGVPFCELDELFNETEKDLAKLTALVAQLCKSREEVQFCMSLATRMLLSAVIAGDRRDTAEFMNGISLEVRTASSELWRDRLKAVEAKLSEFPQDEEIFKVRTIISDRCRAAASRGGGTYRLSVPTGGGKTLASLRYALATAAKHHKKRIILVTPLLSVLEQNAKVIREYVDDDSIICEDHSNVVRERGDLDELDTAELLTETWEAPIIITTLVQLLNTLFSGKSSSIRRMNALADSVIVIDEIQSLPRNMLSLVNTAMNFLSGVCGATIVLCSATHPCLETVSRPLRFQSPPDIIPFDEELYKVFRRTEIVDKRKPAGYTLDEISDMTLENSRAEGSTLLICNTKAEARTLYKTIRGSAESPVFHLSTYMCPAHRLATLAEINAQLKSGNRIICVATQLVEAGVDFSFACVMRVSAGLDNVIQAAGRCNRSGEFGRISPVYIINIRNEKLSRLLEIAQAQNAAESVMENFKVNPESYGGDLSSIESVNDYYRRLYFEVKGDAPDYPLPKLSTTIYELLSSNAQYIAHYTNRNKYEIYQAFRTAGEQFRVFDDNTVDVMVAYGKGAEIIADLHSSRAQNDFAFCRERLSAAKGFMISLYAYELERLTREGGIRSILNDTVYELLPGFYSSEIGFSIDGDNLDFQGV